MNATVMNPTQESGLRSSIWQLPVGAAIRLPAENRARWLRVVDGRVWLTLDARGDELPDDCWLEPGSLSLLPAGRDAVLEGHPAAQFQVLEPAAEPVSSTQPSVRAAAGPLLRDWVRRLSLQPDAPSFAA